MTKMHSQFCTTSLFFLSSISGPTVDSVIEAKDLGVTGNSFFLLLYSVSLTVPPLPIWFINSSRQLYVQNVAESIYSFPPPWLPPQSMHLFFPPELLQQPLTGLSLPFSMTWRLPFPSNSFPCILFSLAYYSLTC